MSLNTWTWNEFVHNLHVKLSHWQATWPNYTISIDPNTDRSWIDTLFHLRACAGARLDEVRQEQRDKLVGYSTGGGGKDENTCFFGELRAAGVAQSVIRNPDRPNFSSQVRIIEEARSLARALPRRPTPSAVLEPWKQIARIPGFGPASASRLLMTDRPDLYLMLNSRSKGGLSDSFGLDIPDSLQMPGVASHYEAILSSVYRTPWWHEDETAPPRPLIERFLWDNRTALVDVFVYDPNVG